MRGTRRTSAALIHRREASARPKLPLEPRLEQTLRFSLNAHALSHTISVCFSPPLRYGVDATNECKGLQWQRRAISWRVDPTADAAWPVVRAKFRQMQSCKCGARADEYRTFAWFFFALPFLRSPLWLVRILGAPVLRCPRRTGLPARLGKLQFAAAG